MQFKTVFWDFDGVWSKDLFYKSFPKDYPQVWEFIQTHIWGPNGEGRVDSWMKGELKMTDINKLISRETGMNFDVLTKKFLRDISQMDIEMGHILIVKHLKKKGIKVGMITNNMDVFDTITKPRLKLGQLFDNMVFNSFAHKKMKADGLFDIAMKTIGHSDYSNTLLIDDSSRARAAFEAKGGKTYAYTTFEDFRTWANNNLLK
jgi:FMN phosphatase YigB (HAD superfamily)